MWSGQKSEANLGFEIIKGQVLFPDNLGFL